MKKTITITLEIEVRDMSKWELSECGVHEDDFLEEGGLPTAADYTAEELADRIPLVLKLDETQDEMFAGSDMYVRIANVRLKSFS